MGEKIELIAIDKIAPDALTNDHKSVVDAINKVVANQKAIAEAAGIVAVEEPSAPVDGTATPEPPAPE